MRIAWRDLALVVAAVIGLLLALAHGYGYHRDELYFIAIGGHPAWGYVDQPPLVPLLAHAAERLAGGSLTLFRVWPALATGGTVLLTGLLAGELGGGRGAQVLAAACLGAGAVTYGAGHLNSTTAYDLLCWAAVTWLAVRGTLSDERLWLLAGAVAGVGLEVKSLMAFLVAGLAAGVLLTGPRRLLRSPWVWGGAVTALLLWAPNLVWQATHGWPQLDMAGSIASGGSGTSSPRLAFVPLQLFLVSPLLAPVWVIGLVRLLRSPRLREVRFLGVAYLVLLVVFVGTGGKPYYLAGLFPALLGAGAVPVAAWASAGRARLVTVVAAVAVSAAVSAVLFLPVVPADRLAGTVVTANYDAGEQVGWPAYAAQVARVARRTGSPHQVVLTGNYGEAGALMRYEPRLRVYSGHNALADLGPPPDGVATLVAVGFDRSTLDGWFRSVRAAGTLDNGLGVDNDEQGTTVWVARGPRRPWAELWPRIRHLG